MSSAAPRNLQEEIGKRRPFDLPEEEAYLNLVRTTERLGDAIRQTLSTHGLSEPQYNVLRIVVGHGKEGLPSQAIAQDMVCRDPDVTRLVDRLEKQGLVARRRDAEDRRRVWVAATDAGRDRLKAIAAPLRAALRGELSHLGPTKLARLSRLLFDARHPPT